MPAKPQAEFSSEPLTIRVHLTDGSVHSFVQPDPEINERLWRTLEPARLFAQRRIIVGSEHSKSVFIAAEIIRVDFVHGSFERWEYPHGYTDIVELSEAEFHRHARLGEPSQMVRRDRPNPVGDLLVSFIKLHLRGSQPLFVMVEIFAKLPAENQGVMQFLLSKTGVHVRLRGGGISVVNLANLAGYITYPGVAQIPADSWLAEPVYDTTQSSAAPRG
jgi:hypothetical protein